MKKFMTFLLAFLLAFPYPIFATVTTLNNSVTFTCTGATGPYPFTFPISDPTAMTVVQVGTVLSPTAYTIVPVNNNYDNGGSVTLNTACSSGTLVLKRSTPLTQTTSFTNYMPTLYKSIENGLDKLTEMEQDWISSGGGGGGGGNMTWPLTPGIMSYAGANSYGPSYQVGTSSGDLVQLNSSGQIPASAQIFPTSAGVMTYAGSDTYGTSYGVSSLTVAPNSVLVTDPYDNPSFSTTLPNGLSLTSAMLTNVSFSGTMTNSSLSGCVQIINGVFTGTGSLCGSGNGGGGGNVMVWPSSSGVVPYAGNNEWGTPYQVGIAANDLVQLTANGALPAVSGALLTNLPAVNQAWPASPGVALYGGGNSWGVSYGVSGNGTSLATNNSPTFTGTTNFGSIYVGGTAQVNTEYLTSGALISMTGTLYFDSYSQGVMGTLTASGLSIPALTLGLGGSNEILDTPVPYYALGNNIQAPVYSPWQVIRGTVGVPMVGDGYSDIFAEIVADTTSSSSSQGRGPTALRAYSYQSNGPHASYALQAFSTGITGTITNPGSISADGEGPTTIRATCQTGAANMSCFGMWIEAYDEGFNSRAIGEEIDMVPLHISRYEGQSTALILTDNQNGGGAANINNDIGIKLETFGKGIVFSSAAGLNNGSTTPLTNIVMAANGSSSTNLLTTILGFDAGQPGPYNIGFDFSNATFSGPAILLPNGGSINSVDGTLQIASGIPIKNDRGIMSHQGVGGSYGANAMNFFWNSSTGNIEFWVDTTNIGNINANNSPTFTDSLVNSSGTVTLSGDSASPGNGYYYRTNSSGTKGWYNSPSIMPNTSTIQGTNVNGAVVTILQSSGVNNSIIIGDGGSGDLRIYIGGTCYKLGVTGGAVTTSGC